MNIKDLLNPLLPDTRKRELLNEEDSSSKKIKTLEKFITPCRTQVKVRALDFKRIFVKLNENTPDDFGLRVFDALKIIQSKEVGKRLLEKIENSTHKVHFEHSIFKDGARYYGLKNKCIIWLSEKDTRICGMEGNEIEVPFFVIVAHELIHAYHYFYDKVKTDFPCSNIVIWTNQEEYTTILGSSHFPQRKRPKISENAIRLEHALPMRFSHLAFDHLNNEDCSLEFFAELEKFKNLSGNK